MSDITDATTSDEPNNTDPDQPTSSKKDKFTTPIDWAYDTAELAQFISEVFHDDNVPPEGGKVLFWAETKGRLGRPLQKGMAGLESFINKGKSGALYFNIASFYDTPKGLRHTHDNFAAMHLMVCDDVGEKIDPARFTELGLEPTYILESSPGSFQYGFVFDAPIEDYELASAVVQAFNIMDMTDKGGVQAGKVVRLPAGVNGKSTPEKRHFPVKLVHMDGPLWTPEKLIEHLQPVVHGELITWDMIKTGVSPLKQKTHSRFMTRPPTHFNTIDVQDVIVDWLNHDDSIIGDSGGDWITIECPWAHTHTTGDNTAGYSPLGRGDGSLFNTRAFKCFHDHCKTKHTTEFLDYVLMNSDLREIAMVEPCNIDPSSMVFYHPQDRVFDIRTKPIEVRIEGFRRRYNETVVVRRFVSKQDGEAKFSWDNTTEANYWLNSPYRINADVIVQEPSKPRIYTTEHHGQTALNLFMPPPWTDGPYDEEMTKPFLEHVKFLLPEEEEREWFMQMLAAKVQKLEFRGTAVVMRTQEQGVGRNTLARMIGDLMGEYNVSPDLNFDDVVKGAFNSWQTSLVVLCSEAMQTGDASSRYRDYEALKKKIDTTNVKALINPKGLTQYECTLSYMTFIFSNHMDAIYLTPNDRRITVLTNPLEPREPAYYHNLRAWMDEHPDWAKHVYRMLRGIPVDFVALQRPLETAGKETMMEDSVPKLRNFFTVADAWMQEQGIDYFKPQDLTNVAERCGMLSEDDSEFYVKKCLDDISRPFHRAKANFKVGAGRVRPRVRISTMKREGLPERFLITKPPPEVRNKAMADLDAMDVEKLHLYIADNIDV